jgi:hypothetical protein
MPKRAAEAEAEAEAEAAAARACNSPDATDLNDAAKKGVSAGTDAQVYLSTPQKQPTAPRFPSRGAKDRAKQRIHQMRGRLGSETAPIRLQILEGSHPDARRESCGMDSRAWVAAQNKKLQEEHQQGPPRYFRRQ